MRSEVGQKSKDLTLQVEVEHGSQKQMGNETDMHQELQRAGLQGMLHCASSMCRMAARRQREEHSSW